MRTLCLIAATGLLITLAAATPAAATGWVTWQVTHNTTAEETPRIFGNWVVFERDSEIYILNLVTNQEVRLTNNAQQEEWPGISRRYVVWSRFDGSQWTVMAWDRATGITTATDLHGVYANISRSYVVCEESHIIDSSYYKQIATQALPGGSVHYLTWDKNHNEYPNIGGNLVVWRAMMTGIMGGSEVFKANLAAGGTPVRITNDSADDTSPGTDGLTVVWTKDPGGGADTEIWAHVPLLGLTQPVTNNAVGDYCPAAWFPRITYVSQAGGGNEVKVLDLWTFATTTLGTTTISHVMEKAEINGPRVVWVDSDGTDDEIFAAAYCSFDDVPHTHPNYFAIQSLADLRILSGYGANLFGPGDPVKRQQYAKMVVGALGIPVTEAAWLDTSPPFSDMGLDDPLDLYPHDFVAVAASNGITLGKTPTTFDPWSNVTRAQVVTMALRGASNFWHVSLPAVPAGWAGHITFNDPTHGGYMRQADYLGVLDGIEGFGQAWDPWAPASRAEVAQILWAVREALLP